MQILKIWAIAIMFCWAVGVVILLLGYENKVCNLILDIGAALTLGAIVASIIYIASIIWGL